MGFALVLTGCSASIKGSVTAEAPKPLTRACANPVKINPKRNLENQWRKDRKNLVICKDRHGSLVKWVNQTQKLIGNNR